MCSRREGRKGRGTRCDGPVQARPHRCVAGADRRRILRRARAGRGRVPQLSRRGARGAGGASADRAGLQADAERAGDDCADRRTAGAEGERRSGRVQRVHQAARDADQRLLREPPRHGHGVEADLIPTRWPSRDAAGRRAIRDGPPAASTSSSDRTRSSVHSRRSTRAPTRRRSSPATSSPRGTRS